MGLSWERATSCMAVSPRGCATARLLLCRICFDLSFGLASAPIRYGGLQIFKLWRKKGHYKCVNMKENQQHVRE
jgi:hypothetical protein